MPDVHEDKEVTCQNDSFVYDIDFISEDNTEFENEVENDIQVNYENEVQNTGVFMWMLQIFKNTYSEEHLRTTASEHKYAVLLNLGIMLTIYMLLLRLYPIGV